MSYHPPRVLHVPTEKGVVKWMSGDVYETLATADSTGGAVGFTVCWVPPGGGPVAHVHKSADESFYLISGSLEFLNSDQTFVANTGDFVFVPRGARHRFRNLTDEQAHMVAFFTPAAARRCGWTAGTTPFPASGPRSGRRNAAWRWAGSSPART